MDAHMLEGCLDSLLLDPEPQEGRRCYQGLSHVRASRVKGLGFGVWGLGFRV